MIEENIVMAFNLFKKKPKKNKSGAGNLPPKPKLEPLAKPNIPGIPEVPNAHETNVPGILPMNQPISSPGNISPPIIPEGVAPPIQPSMGAPEIPPINAPKMPPIQEPLIKSPNPVVPPRENPIPPIPVRSKQDIAEPIAPMGEGIAIPAPEMDKPFMAPLSAGESKEFKDPVEEELIPFDKEEKTVNDPFTSESGDELPSFPESGAVKYTGEIPNPPAYFSRMGEIREEVERDSRIHHRLLKKPIFVEVNDYRKIVKEIGSIKKDSKKSKDVTQSLEGLKTKMESKLKVWNKELEKIQRNLVFMDKVLFEESG